MNNTSAAPPPSDDIPPRREGCPACTDRCLCFDELVALRKRVNELAGITITDELTGLYNYRHLQQILRTEMERTERTGSPTALIMADLDHFKQVNDTFGHENGNLVLVEAANRIRSAIRKIDMPCRFGGEEIVVILPNTHIEQGSMVAERIRELLAATPVETPAGPVYVTASFGVDVYLHNDSLSLDEFIARADQQMYEAKRTGRNRVVPRALAPDTSVSAEERDELLRR